VPVAVLVGVIGRSTQVRDDEDPVLEEMLRSADWTVRRSSISFLTSEGG
jgi:hypothetical protein